jgi:hypothetical protein
MDVKRIRDIFEQVAKQYGDAGTGAGRKRRVKKGRKKGGVVVLNKGSRVGAGTRAGVYAGKRKKVTAGKKRKPNSWNKFVKMYMKESGMSFREVISSPTARQEYYRLKQQGAI